MISTETSTIKHEYTYDDRGNILTEKEYAVTVDKNGEKVYTLIEANTDTYVYDETWKDKLIIYNGQTITYDAVGKPNDFGKYVEENYDAIAKVVVFCAVLESIMNAL